MIIEKYFKGSENGKVGGGAVNSLKEINSICQMTQTTFPFILQICKKNEGGFSDMGG